MSNYNDYLEEIPKYKSKKSKKVSKSSHKHEYMPCKCVYEWEFMLRDFREISAGCTYCTICGKLKDIKFLWSEDDTRKWDEENPNVPIFRCNPFKEGLVRKSDLISGEMVMKS